MVGAVDSGRVWRGCSVEDGVSGQRTCSAGGLEIIVYRGVVRRAIAIAIAIAISVPVPVPSGVIGESLEPDSGGREFHCLARRLAHCQDRSGRN